MTFTRYQLFESLYHAALKRGAVWALYVTPHECAYMAASLPWTSEARLCEWVSILAVRRMSLVARQTHEAEPDSWPSCSNYPEVFAVDRAAGPSFIYLARKGPNYDK